MVALYYYSILSSMKEFQLLDNLSFTAGDSGSDSNSNVATKWKVFWNQDASRAGVLDAIERCQRSAIIGSTKSIDFTGESELNDTTANNAVIDTTEDDSNTKQYSILRFEAPSSSASSPSVQNISNDNQKNISGKKRGNSNINMATNYNSINTKKSDNNNDDDAGEDNTEPTNGTSRKNKNTKK